MTSSDARTPVSTTVYDALRGDILGGRLTPGDPIPSERVLSERFGVNRHAVREAVKRLQQAGLVHVSQGGATRVLPWSRTGGLELLVDLPAAGDPDAARAGYELRACLAAEIAARGAERATAADRERLSDRATDLQHAREQDDDRAVLDAYRELWDVIVDASQNIAYRLAYNSLLAGEATMPQLALGLLRDELHDVATADALVDAVAAGNETDARAAAATLTERTLMSLPGPEVAVP
jgi:GntR family transcriptional repressor for pyruvate dehydrogenase complex